MTNIRDYRFGYEWYSNATDGATACAFNLDTSNTFSTSGSSLLRVSNGSTAIFDFSHEGGILMSNSGATTSPNRTSVALNWIATGDNTARANRTWVSGAQNDANAQDGFAHGDANDVQSVNGVCIGAYNQVGGVAPFGVCLAYASNAWRNHGVVFGRDATAWNHGTIALGRNQFQATGDAQSMWTNVRAATTNATPTDMQVLNGAKLLMNPSDVSWAFKAYIVARSDETDGNRSMAWKFTGLITKDESANTAFVGTPVKTVIADGASGAWDMSVTADDTDNELQFNCTGSASTNVHWSGLVKISQVIYA